MPPRRKTAGAKAFELLDNTMALSVGYIGLFNGLFDALADGRGARPEDLAAAQGLDAAYVRRWCEAAYAFGLLRQARGRYRLTPFARSALCTAGEEFSGGQILRGLFGTAVIAYNYALHMRDGARPGWGAWARCAEFAPLFGSMMENVQRGTFLNEILPLVPDYAEVGAAGGTVIDMGCANAWFLVTLAERFPGVTGVAMDFVEPNVKAAQAKIEAAGLQGRLIVQQANIAEYRFDRAYDLICMNQVVHDVWDRRAEVLARAREALREGGRIALWDRPFPEDLREVKRLPMHFMVFLNLFEEMGGAHLLSETEMVQGLREAGFADIRTYRVDQGAQIVVVGRV